MEKIKKTYVKPEMTIVEVKMEPIMQASFVPNNTPWGGPFN